MNRAIHSTGLFLLTFLFFGLTLIFSESVKPENKTKPFLAPPPEEIEHFTFGFRESIADSLWLRWIQDSDTCQTYASAANAAESERQPVEDSKWTKEVRHKICDNSWGFKMLDSISRLAPKFEMVYLTGAPTLSILVEDFEGAGIIYDRGIKEYPKDWRLLYRASYHFQYGLKDLPKAAELLNRAADSGAPTWVKSLASRLYSASGRIELGIRALEEYRKAVDPKKVGAIKSIDERIAELRKKLQP